LAAELAVDFARFQYHRSNDSMHLAQSHRSRGTDSDTACASASTSTLSLRGLQERPQRGIPSLIWPGRS
jgi:hypothetical protein